MERDFKKDNNHYNVTFKTFTETSILCTTLKHYDAFTTNEIIIYHTYEMTV